MPEPAQIPFAEAASTLMTFGKYAKDGGGPKTLDQIAEDDAGLLYLDWLFGEMSGQPQFGYKARLFDALKVYLSDSSIKKAVEEAVRGRNQ